MGHKPIWEAIHRFMQPRIPNCLHPRIPNTSDEFMSVIHYIGSLPLRMPYLRYIEACVLVAQPVHVADDEDVQLVGTAKNSVIMSFCGNDDWTRELMSFIVYDEEDIRMFLI